MTETSIEWTDVTWNPVRGCARVSPGCENCYAERVAHRFSGPGGTYEGLTVLGKKGPRWSGSARFVPEKLAEPLSWRKPRRVFVNSMSDLFHEDVTNEQIAAVFGVMAACPQCTFQILMKRPERAAQWFFWAEHAFGSNSVLGERSAIAIDPIACIQMMAARFIRMKPRPIGQSSAWPLPNVWLGVSAEDQQRADERIPLLLQCPAAVRFVSAEPLLGPIDFGTEYFTAKLGRYPFPMLEDKHRTKLIDLLDWIIVGGESGYGARECHVDWIRSIVRQCNEARVACFVKQLGAQVLDANDTNYDDAENMPGGPAPWPADVATEDFWNQPSKRHQGAAVRFLLTDRKGGDPSEWPHDLRVRQFPTVQP